MNPLDSKEDNNSNNSPTIAHGHFLQEEEEEEDDETKTTLILGHQYVPDSNIDEAVCLSPIFIVVSGQGTMFAFSQFLFALIVRFFVMFCEKK
jgi:hypothetical protein